MAARPASVRSAALALLTRRDYTTAELRKKLLDREYAGPDVDEIVRSLTAAGLLNDARVAAAHVRTAAGIKGRGRWRIQRELEARGIDRAIVRDVIAGLSADDESAAIRRFLTRTRLPVAPTAPQRRRVFQQLVRRGFSIQDIDRALGRHGGDDESA